MGAPGWTLVIPVKPLAGAKSRLGAALPDPARRRLALALAADTVAAALTCATVAGVLVVTDDPRVRRAVAALGARVAPDVPGGGLNAAVATGARRVGPGPVAALTADLPALRPVELAAALRCAATGPGPAFVADTAGTGTTLLAAPAGVPLAPHFGPGSAAAHAAAGGRGLAGRWPSLRCDVDTPADLALAVALGVGPWTAATLGTGYGAGMQGTVATFDAGTHSGTLLLDDGTELAFPALAFAASGLRLLRLGQRVRVEQDDQGRISRVALVTF